MSDSTGDRLKTAQLSRKKFLVQDALDTLIEYARDRRLEVELSPSARDMFWPDQKLITIRSTQSKANQVFALMHELGHFLIEEAGRESREHQWPRGYVAQSHSTAKSLVARVDIVREEVEAWDRGQRLAERLGVMFDRVAFDRSRASALGKYFVWATKQPKKKAKKKKVVSKDPTPECKEGHSDAQNCGIMVS